MAPGTLTEQCRSDIDSFYGDVFGWEGKDVPILGQMGHVIKVEPATLCRVGQANIALNRLALRAIRVEAGICRVPPHKTTMRWLTT